MKMRYKLALGAAAIVGAAGVAFGQSSMAPITWTYGFFNNVAAATFPGIISVAQLNASGTATIHNLTVTGTANLPAAGITCSSIPPLTGDVTTNSSCVSSISPGAVVPSDMQAAPGSSVLGNNIGSSQTPAWLPVPSCSSNGGVLSFSPSGVGFQCNFAGSFPAVASGTAAPAGKVGELIAFANFFTPINGGAGADLTSVALTAGDWECSAGVDISATINFLSGTITIGPIANTFAAFPKRADFSQGSTNPGNVSFSIGPQQFLLGSPATIYLHGLFNVAGPAATSAYYIHCRRAR